MGCAKCPNVWTFYRKENGYDCSKKETLKDSLTRILWYYLNNDFNLNMVRVNFSAVKVPLLLYKLDTV